ncbi:YbaY family lipoprotein [Porticoccaceae bacterium LTM1]|nr:YbaY family lipoprotein [Porticoccaceae bacterium LTM1]
MNKTCHLTLVTLLLFLIGCDTRQAPDNQDTTPKEQASVMEQITGTISYRERILLKPDAVIEVKLEDVSRADAPAVEIGRKVITEPGTPPIAFSLEFDPKNINPRMSYQVRATIRRGEQLQMTTDRAYKVLTQGAGKHVDLMLVGVKPAPSKPASELTNTYWKLSAIGNETYTHSSSQREPHLLLKIDNNIATGHGGCNTFSGSYKTDGETLSFSPLMATRKACVEGMDTEAKYLKLLQSVSVYRIEGDTLTLFEGDEPVLKFKAVYF